MFVLSIIGSEGLEGEEEEDDFYDDDDADLVLGNLWKYDADTNAWIKLPSMLSERSEFALVHMDGFIYAIGGKGLYGDCTVSVERYSIEQNRWEDVASCKCYYRDPSAVAVNGRILLYGRVDHSFSWSDTSTNTHTLEMYNPTTNDWQKLLFETYDTAYFDKYPLLMVHGGECYRVVSKLPSRVKPSLTNYSSGKIHVSKIKIIERGRNHRVTARLERDEVQMDLKCSSAFCLDGKAFVFLYENTVMNTGIDVADLGPEGLGKKWEASYVNTSESVVPEFTFDILKLKPKE